VAVLGGTKLEIQTTGGWKSEALMRYIGGVMAAKSGLGESIFRH